MTQTAVKLTRDGAKPTIRAPHRRGALANTRARVLTARNGRPSLRIVSGGVAARQAWFALGMVVTLVAGLLLTLLINTRLAEGTYTRNRLALEASYLADRQEVLTDELDAVRAPAALARQAVALGMVPAASPAFISLAQARVLGVAEAATATGGFTVITEAAPPAAGAEEPGSSDPAAEPSVTSQAPAGAAGSGAATSGAPTADTPTDAASASNPATESTDSRPAQGSTPGATPAPPGPATQSQPGAASSSAPPGGQPTQE